MNTKIPMELFSFCEVFESQRGQRLIESDQIDGDVAYISSTKKDNGINAYISPPEFMVRHKNRMTLSNSGSVGYYFYHNYEFVASDHVTVIWLKDKTVSLNRNIALYLKPVFESMRYKYNFGREISDSRLHREYLLLPAHDGKPDWELMNNYIEEKMSDISWVKISSQEKASHLINQDPWIDFNMDNIFLFEKGKRLVKEDMHSGKTHFIGAISANNGVRQLIDEEPLHSGKCITVNYNGSVGEAFYQEYPFWASDDVNILYPRGWTINRYIAMFLITVIKENRYLYSYGRKWTMDKMKKTKLKLPAKSDGSPDFAVMEQFIKSLPYANKI